jgi:hypothetical protein
MMLRHILIAEARPMTALAMSSRRGCRGAFGEARSRRRRLAQRRGGRFLVEQDVIGGDAVPARLDEAAGEEAADLAEADQSDAAGAVAARHGGSPGGFKGHGTGDFWRRRPPDTIARSEPHRPLG